MTTRNKGYVATKMVKYSVVFLGGKNEIVEVPVGSDILRTLIRGGRVVSYCRA